MPKLAAAGADRNIVETVPAAVDEELAQQILARLERVVAARRAAALREALARVFRPYGYLVVFAIGCALAIVACVVFVRPIALGFVAAFTVVTVGASRRVLGARLTTAAVAGALCGTALALMS
jgi:hypothetical protein